MDILIRDELQTKLMSFDPTTSYVNQVLSHWSYINDSNAVLSALATYVDYPLTRKASEQCVQS